MQATKVLFVKIYCSDDRFMYYYSICIAWSDITCAISNNFQSLRKVYKSWGAVSDMYKFFWR